MNFKKFLVLATVFAASMFWTGCSDDDDNRGGGGGDGPNTLPSNPVNGQAATITVSGTSIEVIFVEPGTFMAGACITTTPITVGFSNTISTGFWIGKYPITQAQYQAVMTGHPTLSATPSFFRGGAAVGSTNLPDNPVERVSWNDINAADGFLERVGGRLPTDSEWEFAARGGNLRGGNNGGTDFTWAGSNTANDVAWHNGNRPTAMTQPVGGLAPNELGIYDMSGNVWEFTSTLWNDLGGTRGGSFLIEASWGRVANRGLRGSAVRANCGGFRIAFSHNSN
ncbi:MAG: formylglycine-generating enzyme family protein [Chitinivibrionia bacterium]|nr:formylglycine-generating enzyme family protein [Chitinivibrionia bacterium]